jgi:hypothetical protein
MKRTFATQGTSLIALFVLLVGLFLTANTAGAQTLQLTGGAPSNITWKPATEVMTIAKTQVEYWHQQGPNGPGTAAYNNQVRHAAYYKAIFASLERGETVGTAIQSSLTAAAMLGGEQEFAFTSRSVLAAIREEAIQLFQ